MGHVDQHAVNNFAQKVQGLIDRAKLTGATVKVSFGRRYARIYKEWGGQSLCWGWVDMTNGDIRRGGWKAPDMRVPPRGKITDPGIIDKMLWTGPPYHNSGGGIARGSQQAGSGTNAQGGPVAHAYIPPARAAS